MEYFCKHMEKVYFQRNQTIYVKDQPVSHLYVVKKGQFELSKPLNKNLSSNTAKILELLGMEDIKNRSQNLIGRRLPELQKEAPQNLPQDLRLYQHNVGAIMGEQDLIKEISYVQEEGKLPPPSTPRYAGTLKCTSQRAKVYVIHKDHFLALKASTDSHLLLLN
jgi:CRP-like cAMP-binding protein